MSTISGIITDAVTSTPIEGCRVILTGTTTLFQPVSQNVLSSPDGSYAFNSVPNGTYFLRAYKDEYDDYGTLFSISSTGTYTRNISLNPKHVVISSPKYFCQFTDIKESKTYRIELHKFGFTGSSTQIQKMSDTPAVVSYRSLTKSDQEKIQTSELRFVLIISKADIATYEDIFQSEYKDWRVELYVDDVLDWVGYLQPDAIDRPVFDQEITINMTATDALKDLKEYQFDAEGKISIMQAIRDAISPIGIHLPFRIKYGVRETTQNPDVLSWLTQKINTIAFATDQHTVDVRRAERRPRAISPTIHYKLDNCYSVLEKLLGGCRAVLRQIGGKYVIQNLHEGDTYYYELSWGNIENATRVVANDIVDMAGKTYHITSNFSNIVPVKELHITHYNRNLGESLANFNDYNNWTYDNWAQVIINNNSVNLIWTYESETEGKLTFNDPLHLSPITDRDYIQISLSSMYYLSNPKVSLPAFLLYIEVTKPDGLVYRDHDNAHWPDKQSSSEKKLFITGPSEALRINQEGNYHISIFFYRSPFPHPYVGVCTVRNIEIKQVVMAGEDKFDSDVTFDTHYNATISKGKIVEEHDIFFADAPRTTDLGIILIDDGFSLTPSVLWKRDHVAGDMPFVNLYALQYLSDRCKYKDYITLTVIDPDLEILPSSWVQFDRDGVSRTYRIVGHSRDLMNNNLTLTLEQVLSDDVDMTINQIQLPSVSGEGGKRSTSVLPPAPEVYTHPSGFTNQPESPLSEAAVISQITVNEQGHVTGVQTRNLSAGSVGALSGTLTEHYIPKADSEGNLVDSPLSINAQDKVVISSLANIRTGKGLMLASDLGVVNALIPMITPITAPAVGASLGGGLFVKTFTSGGKTYALIVGNDLGTAIFGCSGTSISTSTDEGTSKTNTDNIISGCATEGIAARVARAYSGGDYTDWSLPSKDDLASLYTNRVALDITSEAEHTTSSEGSSTINWVQSFFDGSQYYITKTTARRVRPVRYHLMEEQETGYVFWTGETWMLSGTPGGGGVGEVNSVFGRTGNVIAQVGDYSEFYEPLLTKGLISASGALSVTANRYAIGGTAAIAHSTAAGYKHVPSGGATSQLLIYGGSSGTTAWSDMTDAIHGNRGGAALHPLASTSANGFLRAILSAHDGKFLRADGTWVVPPSGEGDYTLPLAANGTRGGIQIGYAATGANIPVLLASEKAYVSLSKAAIENVLTGEITSHTHPDGGTYSFKTNIGVSANETSINNGDTVFFRSDGLVQTVYSTAVGTPTVLTRLGNLSPGSLIGTSSGGSLKAPIEITLGSGLTMSTGGELSAEGGGGSNLEIELESSNTFTVSLSTPKLHKRTLNGNASITVAVGSSTVAKTAIIVLTSTSARTVTWTGTGIKWQDDVPLADIVADWTYVVTLTNRGNALSDVLISFVRVK